MLSCGILAVSQNNNYITRLYKRISVVQNNKKQSTNDDAHFITFTRNGFYVSDSKGYSLGGNLVKFVKNDNNLHCYRGVIDGVDSEVFFSNDYSRINIKCGDVTCVYQREPGMTTTAEMRGRSKKSTTGQYYVAPVLPNVTPNSTSTQRSSTRRVCPMCHGTGKGLDQKFYRPDVTGKQANEYCSICKSWGSPHTHQQHMCRTCYGKGTVE